MVFYKELFLATTDTVVGIGAPVSDKNKNAIFALKKRSKEKQLIVMIGSLEQARKIQGWSQKIEKLSNKYWPGAVTLVLSKKLALRMPNCKGLCDLIKKIGPIYMTSANISGSKILNFEEAKLVFNNIGKYYNFGKGSGKPSRIIDVQTERILR